MADSTSPVQHPQGLTSKSTTTCLQKIADLRARGVGSYIHLPHIVVCGDRSVGKSSVLEAVTGIPFPRDEGLCTRFPTKIVLRHVKASEKITATIILALSRSTEEKRKLKRFQYRLESFQTLPDVIAKAGELMGVRGYGNHTDGPRFSGDTLRIEVEKPCGPHLTLIDLPGLFEVACEGQSEIETKIVNDLAEKHLTNNLAIILAVVQASNDVQNQEVIQKSRRFDPEGQRTIGIITKPDLINEGAEFTIAKLAKNKGNVRLNLGWFLLKNPSPKDRKFGISKEQRSAKEKAFFQQGLWQEHHLDLKRIGIEPLQKCVQGLLDSHIKRELPYVHQQLLSSLEEIQSKLANISLSRNSAVECRVYLIQISTEFSALCEAGANGHYNDSNPFFLNEATLKVSKLRTIVQKSSDDFSAYMHENGASMKLVEWHFTQELKDLESKTTGADGKHPQLVEMKWLLAWVKEVYEQTGGMELADGSNHVLISSLFHKQSERWLALSSFLISELQEKIEGFVNAALDHIVQGPDVTMELRLQIRKSLRRHYHKATEELNKLWGTFEGCDSERKNDARIRAGRVPDGRIPVDAIYTILTDLESILNQGVNSDMTSVACKEALMRMSAFYNVACKIFVDNILTLVIERHLLKPLPRIFTPTRVARLTDEELIRIAGEPPEVEEERKRLREMEAVLKGGLEYLGGPIRGALKRKHHTVEEH